MNKFLSNLKFLLLIGVLFAFVTFTGCNDDDESSNASLLIGLWTITDADIDADIGGLSIIDYFIDMAGLSELEAEAFATLFDALLEATFTGTIEIKDDNTYITNFGGEIDDGTWSLNSAGDKIILDAGTADEMVINIVSLTETTLIASVDTTELTDIDDNTLTPDIEVSLSVQLTLTK